MSYLVSLLTQACNQPTTYELGRIERLKRFLILGSDSDTFYSSKEELTKQNLDNIRALIDMDSVLCAVILVDMLMNGNIPRRPIALLLTYFLYRKGGRKVRIFLEENSKHIFRTPTDVFTFCSFVEKLDGKWNRGLKRFVSLYYKNTFSEYHALKYQQREGFSHKDVLRLVHTKPLAHQESLFKHVLAKEPPKQPEEVAPDLPLAQVVTAIHAGRADPVQCLEGVPGLAWEMLPTEVLNQPQVLKLLLQKMPVHAFMRNILRFLKGGLRSEVGIRLDTINGGVHPVQVLLAWGACKQDSALDCSLKVRFKSLFSRMTKVKPFETDKKTLVCLDVSPSMSEGIVARTQFSPAQIAAALALPFLNFPGADIAVFASGITVYKPMNPYLDYEDFIAHTQHKWNSTDCSLPFTSNLGHYDLFIIITDNETNTGSSVDKALTQYRNNINKDAKLVVIGLTATDKSLFPSGMMGCYNLPGFDTSLPSVLESILKS
jgi:60 kDa SS-A/Ro ribonucleoprotein